MYLTICLKVGCRLWCDFASASIRSSGQIYLSIILEPRPVIVAVIARGDQMHGTRGKQYILLNERDRGRGL